jgi:hypothetical protein
MSASIVQVILSIFKPMHYHILKKIVCVMTRDVPKCLLKLMYLIKQYSCFGWKKNKGGILIISYEF